MNFVGCVYELATVGDVCGIRGCGRLMREAGKIPHIGNPTWSRTVKSVANDAKDDIYKNHVEECATKTQTADSVSKRKGNRVLEWAGRL